MTPGNQPSLVYQYSKVQMMCSMKENEPLWARAVGVEDLGVPTRNTERAVWLLRGLRRMDHHEEEEQDVRSVKHVSARIAESASSVRIWSSLVDQAEPSRLAI